MDKIVYKLNDVCKKLITYENVNNIISEKHKKEYMRDIINGVSLQDAIFFKMLYTLKNTKKKDIAKEISKLKGTTHVSTSYDRKQKHIPFEIYQQLSESIANITEETINKKKIKAIAFDGSNNNDKNINVCLNMGVFDITNNMPIFLNHYGHKNRNKEIEKAIEIISNNLDVMKNNILIFDRFYFSYKFIDFLKCHNLKFIIRAKGDAKFLDEELTIKNNSKDKALINKLKGTVKVIHYKEIYTKTIFSRKTKKNPSKEYTFEIENNCVLVTNLSKTYKESTILSLYRSRWDIETYFKLVKNNFKFQHIKDKTKDEIEKTNFCILIWTNLCKLFSYFSLLHKKPSKFRIKRDGSLIECNVKVNETDLIQTELSSIIKKILNFNLTIGDANSIVKNSRVDKNEKDRHFPRVSKIPFSKWNSKSYSISSQLIKILRVLNKELNKELNKNLKIIAKKIRIISVKDYS